eukprot:jgi/Ulvmu1/6326/UM029_0034.1
MSRASLFRSVIASVESCSVQLQARAAGSLQKAGEAITPTITEGRQAFEGDLRATSGLGLHEGLNDHTSKWLQVCPVHSRYDDSWYACHKPTSSIFQCVTLVTSTCCDMERSPCFISLLVSRAISARPWKCFAKSHQKRSQDYV